MLYFNSRPSARGDEAVGGAIANQNISIHAPPRGATQPTNALASSVSISIHAPPRGATVQDMLYTELMSDFNSRPSARGDEWYISTGRASTEFQFTPLREGRLLHGANPHAAGHFNSRPSARGDPICYTVADFCRISIHAPPRGATLAGSACDVSRNHFNSRPSARGDAK